MDYYSGLLHISSPKFGTATRAATRIHSHPHLRASVANLLSLNEDLKTADMAQALQRVAGVAVDAINGHNKMVITPINWDTTSKTIWSYIYISTTTPPSTKA